jgi:hypothetical protein
LAKKSLKVDVPTIVREIVPVREIHGVSYLRNVSQEEKKLAGSPKQRSTLSSLIEKERIEPDG